MVPRHRRRGDRRARRWSGTPRTSGDWSGSSTPSTPRPASRAGRSRPRPSTATSTPARSCRAPRSPTSTASDRLLRQRAHPATPWTRPTAVEPVDHELGAAGDGDDFTEIESSPAVADGKVLVRHRRAQPPGQRAGLVAARRGDRHPGLALRPRGRADRRADGLRRRLVVAERRPSTAGWCSRHRQLPVVARGLGSIHRGHLRRRPRRRAGPAGRTSPTSPTTTTSTSPARPTCSGSADRDLVGLGNKDGTYYAVDRDDRRAGVEGGGHRPGARARRARTSRPVASSARPPYSDGMVAGGTGGRAVRPTLHAIDAATGDIIWQSKAVQATYAPSAVVNGVLFHGGNDFTLRAFDLTTGDDALAARDAGRGRRRLGGRRRRASTPSPASGSRDSTKSREQRRLPLLAAGPDRPDGVDDQLDRHHAGAPGRRRTCVLEPTTQTCVDSPCDLFATGITLRPPPAGLHPTVTVEVHHRPVPRRRSTRPGLGRARAVAPARAVRRPTGRRHRASASSSPRATTTRSGGVPVCSWPRARRYSVHRRLAAGRLTSYNRISLLALERPDVRPDAVGRGRPPHRHHLVRSAADPGRRHRRRLDRAIDPPGEQTPCADARLASSCW